MTNFLSQLSTVTSRVWLLPLSIRAFSISLLPKAQISLLHRPVLQSHGLPEKIIYDYTLAKDKGEGVLNDFFVFIRCGLVASHSFLRMLFTNYATRARVEQSPFTGMLEEFMRYYETEGEQIEQFGAVFEEGFLETTNGHLLSSYMKQLLGCLLQFLWSQKVNHFSFHYKNFIIWLIHLGFPVDFPEQILLGDYVAGIETCLKNKGEKLLLLKKVGELDTFRQPTTAELIATVETYQATLNEIRGQKNETI